MVRRKILIVDDEKEFLGVLKETLELRGFDVAATANAVEAGILLAAKKPDLILMDVKMPGINGFQACEAIRRNSGTRDIPVIIISALADEEATDRARGLGILDYFVKPVDIERLMARINFILKAG
jgi:DNA-binding response OmpR family regulator